MVVVGTFSISPQTANHSRLIQSGLGKKYESFHLTAHISMTNHGKLRNGRHI